MSRETFRDKASTPNWDRLVNLPDGKQGLFIRFEHDIELTCCKDSHNYGMVSDLKPMGAYAIIGLPPFGTEVKVDIDKLYEVN